MLEGVIRLLKRGVLRVREDMGRKGTCRDIASEAVALETVHVGNFRNKILGSTRVCCTAGIYFAR